MSCILFVRSDTHYGTVSGTVIDFETKAPIENTVILHLGNGMRMKTDSEGRFRLEQVPVGVCNLEISRDGYPTIRYKEFEVASDSNLVLKIILSKYPAGRVRMPMYVPDSAIHYKMRYINPEEKLVRPDDSLRSKKELFTPDTTLRRSERGG